ncbi:LTA synthase family protein [Methylomonas koyamae]|uniref:Sulfatase N-terminal domain-containing protein n=1 Tax=Methylomonas koyamae TaxID=702114 RepID=A0AA91I5M8_9GAMM|nr:LTA synthase family protein [Methylomonas koyamae]OAI27056.1 hypothetical protein A1356_10130 [Methylomonas koyamae]
MAKRLGVFVFLLAPLLLKGLFVDSFIYEYTGTPWLGWARVLANDAVVYAALLALLYLSCWPGMRRPISALLRLSALALFTVYWIDYLVIANFDTHLALGDAIKYAGYSHKYLQQIYGLPDWALWAIALPVLAAIAALVSLPYRLPAERSRILPLFAIAGLPLISGFTDNDVYAHAWIYKNVFDYNLTIRSEASAYSPAFIRDFRHEEAQTCLAEPAQRKNIVILMVESLSAYQSRYFSGIRDWTPELDAIAANHLAFRNFYANGFITEDGEIALLTGLPPVYSPSSYSDGGSASFAGFYGVEQALPKRLKAHGYRSEFLTSADLEFGNTGTWAKSIGFDYIEGHDHPDYAHWDRYHFRAAPDEALYLRALDRIAKAANQPLLLFIKTVSTHHPYVDPETKQKSEEAAFRYADKQLGRFVRQLEDRHFFRNGLLLVVGDHHSMTPLKKEEAAHFGHYKASAKVPLLVVSGNGHADEDRQFQQTDVFNTLQGMVDGRQCRSDWQGVLWGEHAAPPRFIAHRRGDNRDKVSVFSEDGDYLIKLDGDDTRLGSDGVDPGLSRLLVGKINALRLARLNWLAKSAETSN